MQNFINLAGVCLAASMLVMPALADNDKSLCQEVTGSGTWTLIPSPNDPLGRVIGPTTGSLKATTTAYLTSLAPQPSGALVGTSVEIWAIDDEESNRKATKPGAVQNVLIFNGAESFTPIADQPVGTVQDALTLTVAGGTGIYAGATGTINVTGTGYNLFGPNAGPGNTFFKITYRGKICRAQ